MKTVLLKTCNDGQIILFSISRFMSLVAADHEIALSHELRLSMTSELTASDSVSMQFLCR